MTQSRQIPEWWKSKAVNHTIGKDRSEKKTLFKEHLALRKYVGFKDGLESSLRSMNHFRRLCLNQSCHGHGHVGRV